MRARPRTWPSIRFSRFMTDDLAGVRMPFIYPYGVSVSSGSDMEHSVNASDPVCRMHGPEKHRKSAAEPASEAVPQGSIYTCPMHPQIRQVGPGNCSICGMTLEPVTATADVGENSELA